MRALPLLVVTLLVACGASPRFEPLHLRQLSLPVPITDISAKNGGFKGLDRIGRHPDGTFNLNILVVHGIGWTLDSNTPLFGHDLVAALNNAHGIKSKPFSQSTHLCPQSDRTGPNESKAAAGGLNLHLPESLKFISDDPQTPFHIRIVGCLDRTKILVPDGTITVYRLLWDDVFYNAFDYLLVGYDDRIQTGHEQPQAGYAGYEDLSSLRRPGTREIRDSVLTYGMVDAALYMGPVGRLMRAAVLGAICTTINEASGSSDDFIKLGSPRRESQFMNVDIAKACSSPTSNSPTPLAIVAESLGSRIVFDVLSKEQDPGLAAKLGNLKDRELEVFLMANQIPLVAASRLSLPADQMASTGNDPVKPSVKYVAFTEVDDLLSYELVPYFEHLAYLRCRLANPTTRELQNTKCGASDPFSMVRRLKGDEPLRKQLVQELGFDVVDVRVKFSPPIHPLYGKYADYQEAHTGYLRNDQVVRALICGAKDGKVATTSSGSCEK